MRQKPSLSKTTLSVSKAVTGYRKDGAGQIYGPWNSLAVRRSRQFRRFHSELPFVQTPSLWLADTARFSEDLRRVHRRFKEPNIAFPQRSWWAILAFRPLFGECQCTGY